MNILLWVLQIVLALHTVMGAVWKLSHSAEQTMPSLKAIPHGVWLAMSVAELACSVALVLPLVGRSFGAAAPIAALFIVAEMLLFCALHLSAGRAHEVGPMLYWLVVAALCAFVAYGRFVLAPL